MSNDQPGDGRSEPPAGTPPTRTFVGTGFYWPAMAGTLLSIVILVLIFQNTDSVKLEWLWFDIEAPLVVIVLVTALTTGLLTELFGWLWRRRRRRMLTDRAELRDLKRR